VIVEICYHSENGVVKDRVLVGGGMSNGEGILIGGLVVMVVLLIVVDLVEMWQRRNR